MILLDSGPKTHPRLRLEFKAQDVWIGFYYEVRAGKVDDWPGPVYERPFRHVWVCLVPMLPVHISWLLTGEPEVPLELLESGPPHEDCDCIGCRPWTT